jgi:hypothetical protein
MDHILWLCEIMSRENCGKEKSHHLLGFHGGRVPRFDTPTREVMSCERNQHLSLSRRLRVEGTDSKMSYTVLLRRSQPSIQRDTWCAIGLLAFSPIATLKHKD